MLAQIPDGDVEADRFRIDVLNEDVGDFVDGGEINLIVGDCGSGSEQYAQDRCQNRAPHGSERSVPAAGSRVVGDLLYRDARAEDAEVPVFVKNVRPDDFGHGGDFRERPPAASQQ